MWPALAHMRSRLALVAILSLFLGNGRYMGSNDTAATRLVPFAVLREGRVCFEDSSQFGLERQRLPYYFVTAGRHVVSRYPVATGLLALPVYLPAALGSYAPLREHVQELERLAAATLSWLGVLVVFAIARRHLSLRCAWLATLAYAFGTSVCSVLSKALWQHTGGAFGFMLAIAGLCMVPRPPWRSLCIGLGLGIAVACRSTNLLPALCLGIACLTGRVQAAALLLTAAGLPVLGALGYAAYYFGSPFGTGYGAEASQGWDGVWYDGALGLLISPGRGLFVYAPCLVFAFYGLWRGDEQLLPRRTTRLMVLGIASALALTAKWWCWWGGRSPGERMLSDVLPFFALGLVLWLRRAPRRPVVLVPFAASVVWSIALQVLISYVRPPELAQQLFYDVLSGPWTWRSFAPVAYLLGS